MASRDTGFSTFPLLVYNQVVGLRGAGRMVIAAALVFDAIVDPFLGINRARSRWSGRHPWRYASAIPIAESWWPLRHPRGMSDGASTGIPLCRDLSCAEHHRGDRLSALPVRRARARRAHRPACDGNGRVTGKLMTTPRLDA